MGKPSTALIGSFEIISKLGDEMKNEKIKTCFDCLHCKVSAKSTDECRLCFCAKTNKKVNHKEHYWLKKPLCKKFDDMSD